jgi:hypothetical protein
VRTSTVTLTPPRSEVVSAGPDPAAVLGEKAGHRRRPDLLLALDEHRHPDGQLAAMRGKRREVHGDTRLVVGGAPAVQPPVPLHRLERVTVPVRLLAHRLHVMVRVQQDRGSTGRRRAPPQHRGLAALDGEHFHLWQAGLPQQGGDRLGAGPHVRRRGRVSRYRGDPDQPLQRGPGPWQRPPHRRHELLIRRPA